MLPIIAFPRPVYFCLFAFLLQGMFLPSFSQPANYEAAGWGTRSSDNTQRIAIPARSAGTQTIVELLSVNKAMTKPNEKINSAEKKGTGIAL